MKKRFLSVVVFFITFTVFAQFYKEASVCTFDVDQVPVTDFDGGKDRERFLS